MKRVIVALITAALFGLGSVGVASPDRSDGYHERDDDREYGSRPSEGPPGPSEADDPSEGESDPSDQYREGLEEENDDPADD